MLTYRFDIPIKKYRHLLSNSIADCDFEAIREPFSVFVQVFIHFICSHVIAAIVSVIHLDNLFKSCENHGSDTD
jgi:hypothetical protein